MILFAKHAILLPYDVGAYSQGHRSHCESACFCGPHQQETRHILPVQAAMLHGLLDNSACQSQCLWPTPGNTIQLVHTQACYLSVGVVPAVSVYVLSIDL